MKAITPVLLLVLYCAGSVLHAQTKQELANGKADTLLTEGAVMVVDSVAPAEKKKAVHSPRKATLRSAIIPGWGQAYNKQYWKIPLVYAVVGIPAGTYFYNDSWYKRCRDAYQIRLDGDSARFADIDPKLQVISTESIRFYRNEFRRNRDYSILYTLLAWGLNVVDATVSGHLKEFDISDDLSMKVNPMLLPGNGAKGVSLVISFKQPTHRLLPAR